MIKTRGNFQILSHKIIARNNPANAFDVDILPGGTGIGVVFDFTDRGDRIVIQLLHTGTSGKDLKSYGTVIGAGPPRFVKVIAFRPPEFLNRVGPRLATFLTAITPIVLLALLLVLFILIAPPERRWNLDNLILWLIFIGLIAYNAFMRFGGLSKLVPKGLEAVLETD
jgi:hypothetical protein